MGNYIIKQGDTFEKIAKSHGCSIQDLEHANPGVKPTELQIGQVILLPEGNGHPDSPRGPSGSLPGGQGGGSAGGAFVEYSGPASNFPRPSEWASYKSLWAQNVPLMKLHDSDQEIADIKNAIETVAKEADFDVRAILCIIMQESGGNVRVRTTYNGVRNPGIMQSHNGVEFNPSDPKGSILQMVKDGTLGTKDGPGLKQLYDKYKNYYEAFRAYNSGRVDQRDLNDAVGATAHYVKNTANRLMGHQWNAM